MKAAWAGVGANPSVSAVNYNYINAAMSAGWNANENPGGGFVGRVIPLSDAVIITKLTVWVTTAPATGKSWAFKIRQNGADTSAAVTISDTATTASWTGSVSLSAQDLISLAVTPSGTPTASGIVYWTIEYTTSGNFYLIPGAMAVSAQVSPGTFYSTPQGGNNIPASTVATALEGLVPTDLTVTKIAAYANPAPGGTATYTFRVRKNNLTDSSFSAVVTGAALAAISLAGTLAFTGGDTMVIKIDVTTGGAWTFIQHCISVTPTNAGEIVHMYGSTAAPSTSATNYEGTFGVGSNAWNATEANVYLRNVACTLKKLYVKLVTATGSGKTRAFTLRSAAADTSVVATLTNTAAGNDTTHTAPHGDGNFLAIKAVPTSTPAATAGVKFGFVQVIAQPSLSSKRNFFSVMT